MEQTLYMYMVQYIYMKHTQQYDRNI